MRPDGELPEDRIVVQGSARRQVTADRAVWSLVVTESGEVAAAAFARCGERLDALTSGLREALGEAARLHTGAVTVRPQRDSRGRPLPVVDASGEVTVDVPLNDAGRAAGAAMAGGADQLRGPTLTVGDEATMAEALLGEAVAAARRKAEHVASAAGRRLGRVLSVSEDWEGDARPVLMSRGGGFDDGPDLTPAEAQLAAAVTVLFALED